ncbi:MAG TPA: PAS domain-containing protein, partial [Candidatus Limnocylindrales bacterium]|nr:PAS domain-containing protein [Candidatus Limnocylindrales bacterium]
MPITSRGPERASPAPDHDSPAAEQGLPAPGHGLPAALDLHGFARLAPVGAWLAILGAGLAIDPPSLDIPWFVGGALGWFLPGLVMAFVPWTRIPRPVRLLPVAAYLVGLVAFRHGLGEAGSGISVLALIPILWLGANGTARLLAAGVALMLVAVSAPIVLVGAPGYPPSEWQRVVVLAGVGGFAGLAIQRLVSEIGRQSERVRRHSLELMDQVVVTEAIVDTADDAVISFDESGRVVGFNAAAREMLGWDDASPEGFDLVDTFVVAHDRTRLRAGFGRLIAGLDAAEAATGRPGRARQPRFETELIRRDGSLVPV